MKGVIVSCIITLLAIVTSASIIGVDLSEKLQFQSWMLNNNKIYANYEERHNRFGIFKKNLAFVNEFNAKNDKTFSVKMNRFGDLTNEEFVKVYTKSNTLVSTKKQTVNPSFKAIPLSFDWREKGVVPPVMNEGQCAAVVPIVGLELSESVCAINSSKLVSLSLQQLIDCTAGCNGGDFDTLFKYILTHGLESEAEYPETSGPCRYNASKVVCRLSKILQVPTGNETAMAVDLVTFGPLAAGVDASQSSFQFYESGVYYAPGCSSTELDHALFIVGYGILNNDDYWIAENSWGTSWGMSGYILMSRNRNNNCGIATDTYYGMV